jgi:putative endonuclease
MKQPCVYILASKRNGTLYVGVTSNLIQRVWQHQQGVIDGFSALYDVKRLVWYEQHESMETAIQREKQIKAGSRARKIALIEGRNSQWLDLYDEIV